MRPSGSLQWVSEMRSIPAGLCTAMTTIEYICDHPDAGALVLAPRMHASCKGIRRHVMLGKELDASVPHPQLIIASISLGVLARRLSKRGGARAAAEGAQESAGHQALCGQSCGGPVRAAGTAARAWARLGGQGSAAARRDAPAQGASSVLDCCSPPLEADRTRQLPAADANPGVPALCCSGRLRFGKRTHTIPAWGRLPHDDFKAALFIPLHARGPHRGCLLHRWRRPMRRGPSASWACWAPRMPTAA